ncbi:MAG: T9SS type A sorting domain-containing protein, partial [Bacteroidota bacterium]
DLELSIFDINGKVIWSNKPIVINEELNQRINISHLATGPYWIQLKIGNRYLGQRFTKIE